MSAIEVAHQAGLFCKEVVEGRKDVMDISRQEAGRWFRSIVPGDEKGDVEFVVDCLPFGDKGYIRLLLEPIRCGEPFLGSIYFVFVSGLEGQAHDADSFVRLRAFFMFLHCW